jgi:hypothetical protein
VILNRFAKAVLSAAVVAAAVEGLSPSPAVASGDHSGRAYVHEENSWLDEGDLSTSRHASSNATCLWQKILWADDYLDNAGIDGIFGPDTAEATKRWKVDHGLPNDGKVGINAFRTADFWLRWDTTDGTWKYYGSAHEAWITIDANGRYGFYDDGVQPASRLQLPHV